MVTTFEIVRDDRRRARLDIRDPNILNRVANPADQEIAPECRVNPSLAPV